MRFSEDRIEKLTCSDGIQRDIHIWEPENPRAVFLTVHGGMDHGGNYVLPALYFKRNQMTTVAHDLHGHDHKREVYVPSFDVFLDDLDLMVARVKDRYPGIPVFMLSHSMGGLIATHYGLKRFDHEPFIRGFITSSPYYVNAIKTPGIVKKFLGIFSLLAPRLAIPIEDFIAYKTQDKTIYERHLDDRRDGIMASKVTARFANELLKAQRWIPAHIAGWKQPLLAIVAGNDKLADPRATRELLGLIDSGLLTELYYPENYHENFNELNREEIFNEILKWVEPRI